MLKEFITQEEENEFLKSHLKDGFMHEAFKNLKALEKQGGIDKNILLGLKKSVFGERKEAIECFLKAGKKEENGYFACYIRNMRLNGGDDKQIVDNILDSLTNSKIEKTKERLRINQPLNH